jgi:hypothetical protein
MMNSRANVRPYNAQVLIGNWFEDRVMEEVRNSIDHLALLLNHLGSIKRFSR